MLLAASAAAAAVAACLRSSLTLPHPLLPFPPLPQENQNEVVTVAAVSADGRSIILAAPLRYQHYG